MEQQGAKPGQRSQTAAKTLRLPVDAGDLKSDASQRSLQKAAAILRSGGLAAFPTETVYGLGANALDAAAVGRIFEAKQRPAWDPLIVHVSGREQLGDVAAEVPPVAERLMRAFWPGPLTLLLPRSPRLPPVVTAGRARVGVRMPAHPVALELIRLTGLPIAAPSANSFGRVSPTRAEHVLEDLEGRIDAVVDSGETTHGLESTVLDICEQPPVVYRPGVVTLEQIRAICPDAVAYKEQGGAEGGMDEGSAAGREALPSPGLGLRHYAPRARLLLLDPNEPDYHAAVARALEDAEALRRQGARVGLMLPDELELPAPEGAEVFRWGRWQSEEELARRLFAGLRQLDQAGVALILCPLPAAEGIGVAIRDRLLKAAKRA